MSDALNQASAKYELKRKTKSVSFNVDRAEEKYLHAVADALPDFSGWVKNCLSEEAKLQASGKPFLTFENAADETVAKSNYWRSCYARYGLPFLSTCNDVLRLLLPPQRVKSLVSGICAAKQVRIFSPARCGNPDYFELLFDDGSLFPFVLILDAGAGQVDLPSSAEIRRCIIYAGALDILAELPCVVVPQVKPEPFTSLIAPDATFLHLIVQGKERRVRRTHTKNSSVAQWRHQLAMMRTNPAAELPGGYTCRIRQDLHDLAIFSLSRLDENGASAPLMRLCICTRSRMARPAWEALNARGEPPKITPFCAVRRYERNFRDEDKALFPPCSEFERALTWAWLEDRETARRHGKSTEYPA